MFRNVRFVLLLEKIQTKCIRVGSPAGRDSVGWGLNRGEDPGQREGAGRGRPREDGAVLVIRGAAVGADQERQENEEGGGTQGGQTQETTQFQSLVVGDGLPVQVSQGTSSGDHSLPHRCQLT